MGLLAIWPQAPPPPAPSPAPVPRAGRAEVTAAPAASVGPPPGGPRDLRGLEPPQGQKRVPEQNDAFDFFGRCGCVACLFELFGTGEGSQGFSREVSLQLGYANTGEFPTRRLPKWLALGSARPFRAAAFRRTAEKRRKCSAIGKD